MAQEVTLGGFLVAIGGESLGTMVRWRRAVTTALQPVLAQMNQPGAEAFGEFIAKAAGTMTLEAKLGLIYAWQPGLEEREDELLELATDEELEAAFAALIAHAYPLARTAQPSAPRNGFRPGHEPRTQKSYG